jgi:hypothetical protein
MTLRPITTRLLTLFWTTALVGACSNPSAPAPRDDGDKDQPALNRSPGDWACYPETGNYVVHYVLTEGDPARCATPPDVETPVGSWKGGLGEYPDCQVTTDEATCSVHSECEREDKFVTTQTTLAKGQVPPLFGTRRVRRDYDCLFSFTYTKR